MSQFKRHLWSILKPIVVFAGILLAGAGLIWFAVGPSFDGGDDSNAGRAKMDVRNLDTVIGAYQQRHGYWPDSLEELTERGKDGSPAMVKDDSALIDPWRNRYHYDRTQLNPKTGRPLIWSDGVPGEKRPIKNWN
jgi:hypothetical protein